MDHEADGGAILAVMEALEESWLGEYTRTSTWFYPFASVLHVLGLAFLLGSIAVFDLRILGVASRLPLATCADFLLPIARGAFFVQVGTGFIMFSADADHVYDNPFFLLKLVLIGIALANILLFHWRLSRTPAFYERSELPLWARTGALISLVAWIGVVIFGRMIAYI